MFSDATAAVTGITGAGALTTLVAVIVWLLRAERQVARRADASIARADARADHYARLYAGLQRVVDDERALRRDAEDRAAKAEQDAAAAKRALARLRPESDRRGRHR